MSADRSRAFRTGGCLFGSHRAEGVLPQEAARLDASLPLWNNELLIDVDMLNLDSSSMRQITESSGGGEEAIAARVSEIVRSRGKMHNPVTGSGGVLVGRVAEIGPDFPDRTLTPGTRICTLVSLSLTPLTLEEIGSIGAAAAQIEVKGKAILFETGLCARIPNDIPERIATALFDVAGAPATVLKLATPGQRICVFGAGKAGTLCLFAAREILGGSGLLVAVEGSAAAVEEVRALGIADHVIECDAQDAIAVHGVLHRLSGGSMFDLVINTTNVERTEGAAILATRPGGQLVFFSMSTSFTRAALTAEGAGRDITMIVGNGYVRGWTDATLSLYRRHPQLHLFFERRHPHA
ncbi:zinc-binding dehydrogenase [Aestuariivirga sp.]|uniref:L-erythro-3,5-diaminohexanoate dehydrogenase n=1 Tax=Aestuariivirga sp. TaxID=2650926 RepID=UPI00391CD3A5